MKCGTSGVIWPIAEEEKKIFFFCQRILACNLVVCRRRKIFLLLGFRSLIMYQIWRRSKFLLQIQTYEMWDFMPYMQTCQLMKGISFQWFFVRIKFDMLKLRCHFWSMIKRGCLLTGFLCWIFSTVTHIIPVFYT